MEARSRVDHGHGTLIAEAMNIKDPWRIWWTTEDIPAASPYPCDFEACPELWDEERTPFDQWCRSRFTDPASGTALLVDLRTAEHLDESMFDDLRAAHRMVTISGWKKADRSAST
jgi:hypothetical protein